MTLFHTICSSVQPTSAAPFAALQCLQSGVTIRWRHKKVIHASVMQWLPKKNTGPADRESTVFSTVNPNFWPDCWSSHIPIS